MWCPATATEMLYGNVTQYLDSDIPTQLETRLTKRVVVCHPVIRCGQLFFPSCCEPLVPSHSMPGTSASAQPEPGFALGNREKNSLHFLCSSRPCLECRIPSLGSGDTISAPHSIAPQMWGTPALTMALSCTTQPWWSMRFPQCLGILPTVWEQASSAWPLEHSSPELSTYEISP